MSFIAILNVAGRNIIRRPKTSFKILAGFCLMTILIVSFFTMNMSYSKKIDEIKEVFSEEIQLSIYKKNYTEFEYDGEFLNNMKEIKNYQYYMRFDDLNNGSSVIINNISYNYSSKIIGYSLDDNWDMPYNLVQEYKRKKGDENYIKYGRSISSYSEFLASEDLFIKWGITDYSNLIGSRFTFSSYNGRTIIDQKRLVGIIDKDMVTGSNTSMLVIKNNGIRLISPKYFLNIYCDNYKALDKVYLQMSNKYSGIQYTLQKKENQNQRQIENLDNQKRVMTDIFGAIGFIIISTITLNILLSLIFNIKQKGSFYGLMQATGMKKQQLFLICFIELTIIFVISLLIAGALAIIILKIINSSVSEIVNVSLEFKTKDYILVYIYSMLVGMVLTSIMTTLSLTGLFRKSICNLLKK